MAIVYTGGTFDTPHVGHVNFLRQCKRLAGKSGKVVVALNKDEFIKKFKGKAPLFTYRERKKLLEKIEYVDEVVPNENGTDSKPTILKVKPDYIVIGSDWAKKDYYQQMSFSQDWLDEQHIMLIYVPYTEVISSSEIKRRTTAVSTSGPLVSVGLPTCNRAAQLDKSLKSVLSQTYDNLEVIVSNNHSDDWTQLLLDEVVKKDSRVKVFTQKKRISGIDNSLFVLNKAKGTYFCFAADDDWWDQKFVQTLLQGFENENEKSTILQACLWNVADQRGYVRQIKTSFSKHQSGYIDLKQFLEEDYNGYKGNLYWGLYKTRKLKQLVKRHPWPRIPHNDILALLAVLAHSRIHLIGDRLFTKTEYFNDARKTPYRWWHMVIDTVTSIVVPARILLNIIVPRRLAFFISVKRLYERYQYSIIDSSGQDLTFDAWLSGWRFWWHLIPNDIKKYQHRVTGFAGGKI